MLFKRRFLTLAILLVAHPCWATWSVIAVDRSTGTMVVASATCLPQQVFPRLSARDLRDVQAIVVPGRGVAIAQALVDTSGASQRLIFDELHKSTPPDRILDLLRARPTFENQQFAILDLDGRAAASSGRENLPIALDRQGRLGTTIHYSIQGNILASEDVVTSAAEALTTAGGTLADRVMAAMEAADARGGDRRCSCDRGQAPQARCTTRTAYVAYILQAERTDQVPETYNGGIFPFYISVTDENITREEDANPVKTLRMRYDARLKARN